MVLLGPFEDVLMSSVTERRISGHLAVAELEVARLGDIKNHRAASGDNPLALAVAEGVELGVATTAPVVTLTARKEDVCGENTSVGGHGGGAVLAFLVGARLNEVHHFLVGEVSHVLHGFNGALHLGGLEVNGGRGVHVAFVGVHFDASGVDIDVVLHFLHVSRLGFVVLIREQIINLVIHD
jgi:hypothetical protein